MVVNSLSVIYIRMFYYTLAEAVFFRFFFLYSSSYIAVFPTLLCTWVAHYRIRNIIIYACIHVLLRLDIILLFYIPEELLPRSRRPSVCAYDVYVFFFPLTLVVVDVNNTNTR